MEFELVADMGEVEGGARSEDDDLLRKVAIVRVIKTVYFESVVSFLRAGPEPAIR